MNWLNRIHRGFYVVAEHAVADSPQASGRLPRPYLEDAVIGLLYAAGGHQSAANAERGLTAARAEAAVVPPATPQGVAAQ